MATNLAPTPMRFLCDASARQQVIDLNTGSAPLFYRGDDLQIDIAIGDEGVINASLSNVASVTCQIFLKENDTNPPVMSSTVLVAQMNLNLTQAQWTNNTNTGSPLAPPIVPTIYEHASFIFPNSVTNISLNGQPQQNYWLRITALTADNPGKIITLLAGVILVLDGPDQFPAVSASQPGTIVVNNNGMNSLAFLDTVTGNYFALEIDTVAGVRSVSVGDTAYSLAQANTNLAALAAYKYVQDTVNGATVTALALWDPVTNHFYALEIDTTGGVRSVSVGDTPF